MLGNNNYGQLGLDGVGFQNNLSPEGAPLPSSVCTFVVVDSKFPSGTPLAKRYWQAAGKAFPTPKRPWSGESYSTPFRDLNYNAGNAAADPAPTPGAFTHPCNFRPPAGNLSCQCQCQPFVRRLKVGSAPEAVTLGACPPPF